MIKNPVARAEYARNKSRHAARRKAYYQKNRTLILQKNKAYRLSHPVQISARARRWNRNNLEHVKRRSHDYYLKNREHIRLREKLRFQNPKNRERRRKWMNQYRKRPYVRARILASDRIRRAKRPHLQRQSWLKSKYGISITEYDAMLNSQGGVCAICKNGNLHPTRWGTDSVRLTVDHCHATKKIRGLLCHKCNAALGLLGDSLNRVKAAVTYLSR